MTGTKKAGACQLRNPALSAFEAGFRNQCLQDASAASIGDILMTRLQVRGVAGFVSDGGIRESHEIAGQSHEQEKMEVFLREEIVSGHLLHGMYRRTAQSGHGM